MLSAKLSIINKDEFRFVIINDRISISKVDSIEGTLKLCENAEIKEEITIDDKTLIGRLSNYDASKESHGAKYGIMIHDPSTSNHHVLIHFPPKDDKNFTGFTIEDLNSKSGTLVNESKIRGGIYPLDSMDDIKIGYVYLRFDEYLKKKSSNT